MGQRQEQHKRGDKRRAVGTFIVMVAAREKVTFFSINLVERLAARKEENGLLRKNQFDVGTSI
jgi:hypothetical protein